jgi:hypothetical protein
MCAASLEGIGEAPPARVQTPGKVSPATVIPQSHRQEEVIAPVEQEGIVCPECSTVNEVGWSFCQQCGKRLVQSQPPSQPHAHQPAQVPDGLATNPEQRAMGDPTKPPNLETVAGKPSKGARGIKTVAETVSPDKGLKTVSDKPSPLDDELKDDELKTVSDKAPPPDQRSRPVAPKPPPVDHESKTERQDAAPAPTPSIAPPPAVAPPKIVEAPVSAQAPPTKPRPPAPPPTVVPQDPPQPKPAAPITVSPAQKPAAPARVSPEQSTQQAQSATGALCSQCGQATSIGSAFCASCGAPVTYGSTMVISSVSAPPPILKGRLHLVMEGGQPGEVYDLEDDTLIGRSNGAITFPHDGFMSGKHARIVRRGSSFILTDEGSRNGTFIKIKGDVEIKPGDTILVGKQLFRFEV